MVRGGWSCAGGLGTVIGPSVMAGGQEWVPVLWDDDSTITVSYEDPDWHKAAGLVRESKRKARR